MEIPLFYLSPNTTGGWVTFTYHLFRALESVGCQPKLYKVSGRTEGRPRPFGYGLVYSNVSNNDAMRIASSSGSALITAVAKAKAEAAEDLLLEGAKLVIHDPTEEKNLPDFVDGTESVVIRRTGLKFWPEATFIPHPYKPFEYRHGNGSPKEGCISTSRIDFDKLTHILLDANRLGANISIRGFENRLYTRFNICPKYPEWEQSKAAYPKTADAAFQMLCNYRFMADMSIIKGDGGGTQYTTLEAWNARCLPIIHRDWIIPGHEMVDGVNCGTAHDGQSLYNRLAEPSNRGYDYESYLKPHSPEVVGEAYLKFLTGEK